MLDGRDHCGNLPGRRSGRVRLARENFIKGVFVRFSFIPVCSKFEVRADRVSVGDGQKGTSYREKSRLGLCQSSG